MSSRDRVDARADAPAVGFELRFAGASRADAAAEPRQRVAGADQPRQQVFQLRELHLQLAFARPRAPREDVEDELRAIDDLAADRLFDLPQLRRRQLVVEDDDVDVRSRRADAASVLILPAPRNVDGSGFGRSCSTRSTTSAPAACGEAGELVERSLRLEPPRAAGDQARPAPRARGRGYAGPVLSHA